MKIRTLLLLCVFLLLTACNRSRRDTVTPTLIQDPIRTGSLDESITSSGISRHFRLYVPSAYNGQSPAPLVVNFHGLKSNSTEQEMLSGMSSKAERENFIVAYPDAQNEKWEVGTNSGAKIDKQFVLDMLEWIESHYSIDQKRIYATGISNGGGMTNRMGCDLSNVFAAIAPVSGAYNYWKDCSPNRPVPVLSLHGTADNIVPYEGAGRGNVEPPIRDWAVAWASRNDCNTTPMVTFQAPDVIGETWDNCKNNAVVILYTIEKHGHSWPGSKYLPEITSQAINATDVIWDFFGNHPMP